MDFQIEPLPRDAFAPLFDQSDAALAEQNISRVAVTTKPGAPCRVSLQDAEVGETVLLLNYTHQPADSPYRASHAIYVRETADTAAPEVNEVPDVLRCRQLSLRGFDAADMIVVGEVGEGADLDTRLHALFEDSAVRYAQVHFAARGCFAATVRPA